jgi:glycosyltransferase involved in cell wall biosynthesis
MKEPNEIVYILPELRFGGIQIFALDLAYYQMKLGYKVKILSVGSSCSVLDRYNDLKKETLNSAVSLVSISKLYVYILKVLISGRQIKLHTQGYLLTYVGFFGVFKNISIVHTIQNQAEYEAGLKRMKLHSLYFRKTNVTTVANSKQIARSFESYYGYDVDHTIMNGIDLDNIDLSGASLCGAAEENNHVNLLTVGSLGDHKNQKMLIDAFCKLGDSNASLYIIGDNSNNYLDKPYLDALKNKSIYYMGESSNSLSMMTKCDVFCMSSRNEGLPLVLMEAKLLDMVVVTTDVGGSKEVIDADDFLVKPDDVDGYLVALQDAVKSVRSNESKVSNVDSKKYLMIERCHQDYQRIAGQNKVH